MSSNLAGTKGLEVYLDAAGESDKAKLYQGIHVLNAKIRSSEEPDHDGTSAVTLLAGRMLRAGVSRPAVDQVVYRLSEVIDRDTLMGTVVGILDGQFLYFNIAGAAQYRSLTDFLEVSDATVGDPEESIIWVLASFQKNLEAMLASAQAYEASRTQP